MIENRKIASLTPLRVCSGSTSYSYNSLSRMMSETRTFNNVGSFTLNYDYNLAGELKKISDSTNMTINYGYDSIGRLNGVTGADALVGGVSTYASGIAYRAWGAVRQVTAGGHTTTVNYDTRLRASNFNISEGIANENYDYFADGLLSYSHNTIDNKFDRSFSYDHVGRLTLAVSGGAARNDSVAVPMYETFGYDAWSNIISRDTQSWNNEFSDFGPYANNRRVGWGYDADGRIATIDLRSYTYDSAGQNISLAGQRWTPSGYVPASISTNFDGDGNRIREVSNDTGTLTTTYYLRSTVLRNVVEELSSGGTKQVGYVYSPTGELLATQVPGADYVMLKQGSPTGATQHELFTSTTTSGMNIRHELDPAGADVPLRSHGFHGDAPGDIPDGGGSLDSRFSAINNPGAGCMSGGTYGPCDYSFWGNSIVDLPGFGTEWGSFSDFELWKYERRLAYTRARNGIVPRTREGSLRDADPQNPSPQPLPPGYKPFRTFTEDEQRALDLAYNRALSALDANTECQNFFTNILTRMGIVGRNGDASATLEAIKQNGGFERGNSNKDVATTMYAAGSHSTIIIQNPFFNRTVGGTTREFRPDPDLSRPDAQALTILHELAHAMYRNFHGVPFFMSSDELDRALYDKCFNSGRTPLPKGIS